MFIKNIWYVAAWSHEVELDKPYPVIIADEPIVLWRNSNGLINALEDRCPHRHAPLSLGRIEGDKIQCMYHGLKFEKNGKCSHIPASDIMPDNIDARAFPVAEQGGWIWTWIGDPALANPADIPEVWGMSPNNKEFMLKTGALDYDADYQLINDNLTDLSHLDYVHETTLGAATGGRWSDDFPTLTKLDDRLRIQRWIIDHSNSKNNEMMVEQFNTYDYILPGIFLMKTSFYPRGVADKYNFKAPTEESPLAQWEQQAVTPQSAGKSRYIFSSGFRSDSPIANADPEIVKKNFEIVLAAFAEDKEIIEGQQKIWDLTPEARKKAFIPQDKAPAMFRRMINKRIKEENNLIAVDS
jgi:vanillate O-demethylase monooxygenase subunit